MVRLQQLKQGSYFLIIPKVLAQAKGYEKGQEFKLEFNEEGNIVIKEK